MCRNAGTLGGLLILFAWLVSTLLWANLTNGYVWLAILVTAGFGAVGFVDDLLKVRRRENLGLTARAKLGLLVVVASVEAGRRASRRKPDVRTVNPTCNMSNRCAKRPPFSSYSAVRSEAMTRSGDFGYLTA